MSIFNLEHRCDLNLFFVFLRMKKSHLNDSHDGLQPIRVLQHNILHKFENSNSSFLAYSDALVAQGKIQPGITCFADKFPIYRQNPGERNRTPFVDADNKIKVHETFLSYLWIFSYAITVLHDEAIIKPAKSVIAGNESYKIDSEAIELAQELFQYGKSLIKHYFPWDKEGLPNPENYSDDEAEYVQTASNLFIHAVNFILLHEFAHIESAHLSKIATGKVSSDERKAFEVESDARAIEIMQLGKDGKNDIAIDCGIIVALCSMLYFSKNIEGDDYHPDVDERILNFLNIVSKDENDIIWGVGCLALKLWDDQFEVDLSWPLGVQNFKELFFHVQAQISSLKKP